MKTPQKILACAAALLLAAPAFAAIDEVQVVRVFADGRETVETQKLVKINANTYRLHIPVGKMGRNIDHIDIKREESSANVGEDGYWVHATGALGKFNRDSGVFRSRATIMPIWGVKKGDEAHVAIVKGLKYEYEFIVDIPNRKYVIFPRFYIAGIHTKPYEDIIIDYTHFTGKDANYSSMAREYRKYQLGRGEVKPLKERIIGNPTLKYSTETIYMKLMMASFMREGETHQNRGWHWKVEDDPPIQVYRDFDNVQGVLKILKELDVKADVILTNWNWRSNGRNPISSIAEPELGGMAKCKETTALAKKLGFRISPHMLHTENYTISPAFDKDDIAIDHNGKYLCYMGMGGMGFNPCYIQVFKKHVLPHYDRMAKLGFNGTFHIDVTTAIVPRPCFHIDHFATRQDSAEYMNKVGFLSDAFFGAWSSESSYDHCANTVDYVLYASGATPQRLKASPMVDRFVPMWQIAYQGIIMHTPFCGVIDYNMPDKWRNGWGPCQWPNAKERRVKLVEFGGRPAYYWALNGPRTKEDFRYLKEAYEEFKPLQYLQLEFMDFHGEIAPKVFITRFSDGSEIISNYSDNAYAYKGKDVPPMDYKLFKGGK